MNLLAVSGSLRAQSSNTAVLQAAALLAPVGVSVTLFNGLTELPYFNPDDDGETVPAPVQAWRDAVTACDGLIISSPEYIAGIAGVMKNAIDWLGGSMAGYEKPVAVINASPRAVHADASLKLVLRTMNARVVEEASVALPLLGRGLDAAGIAADDVLAAQLRKALGDFVAAIGKNAADPP